jgi:RNA polymerase sigma-70 factor (ECF subfamily)
MGAPSTVDVGLLDLLERTRAGDLRAREDLFRIVCGRLERLAGKMLRSYPRVGRWAQAEDIVQNVVLRLLRSLQEVRPDSARGFFNLAAEMIRRELIDLARHFYGAEGMGAHHDSQVLGDSQCGVVPVDDRDDAAELEKWCAFHQQVERLPFEEREVVGLIFYHGWKQAQVAELFQVSERTVRRWWESALRQLNQGLQEPHG